MPRSRKILYLQYSNPAAYPPLEHSSRLLADRGWEVVFLGAQRAENFELESHPNIRVKNMAQCPPGFGPLHFALFCVAALMEGIRFRPDWVYVSDPTGCPAGVLARLGSGARMIYHEHDFPGGKLHPVVAWARRRLALSAQLCVVPNAQRGELLQGAVGTLRSVAIVWNCPLAAEAAEPKKASGGKGIQILYHGSIVPQRLPLAVIEALRSLPEEIGLTVSGYETAGSYGYAEQLRQHAEKIGLGARVRFQKPVATRAELLRFSRDFDAGLSLISLRMEEPNLRRMAGASNKTFDYLACGLAVLVPEDPAWRGMFVETGYGLACDPDDPASIAQALRRWLEDPEGMRRMGELGRRRIGEAWNYEKQFTPVLVVLEGRVV
jgi:glycosyltransferase involved in cell wall biosynthesis